MAGFIRRNHLIVFIVSMLWTFALLSVPTVVSQVAVPASQATISVLITLSDGKQPLSKNQLTVLLDNHPAEIQNVIPAHDQPLVFAVLFDISGSLRDQQAFEEQSAVDLFRTLAVSPNTAYFGDFNEELFLRHEPASMAAVIKELKEVGRFRGGTALHDAVLEAAKLVNRGAKGTDTRRAVFVFTDGDDGSSKLSLKRLIPELQKEGVPVFCIGLPGRGSPQKSVTELRTISDSTGGIAHVLSAPTEFMPSLLSEVEDQYWLTLTSPSSPDGKMHSLLIGSGNTHLRIAAPQAALVK